jgi:hypothetical protein
MYEKYMICDKSLRPLKDGPRVIGYQFDIKIPYYRGVFLCMVHELKFNVNGEAVDNKNVTFTTADGVSFDYDELETVTGHRWEFGQPATISVRRKTPLLPGPCRIHAEVTIRIPYMPVLIPTVADKTIYYEG